jgi:hypothetical protein
MGLESDLMADQQFTASSVHDNDERFGPAQARLNGKKSWVPATLHNQWIQVLTCYILPQSHGAWLDEFIFLTEYVVKFYMYFSKPGMCSSYISAYSFSQVLIFCNPVFNTVSIIICTFL